MTDSKPVEVVISKIDRPYSNRRLAYAQTKSPLLAQHNNNDNKKRTRPLLVKMTDSSNEIDKREEEKTAAELAPEDEEVEESC